MAKIAGEIPKYLKLYEKLRKQIINGYYQPNDLLPSENELRNQWKITQPVVRQALSLLADEGFIKKHQGKGSIVQARPVGVGIMSAEGEDITSQMNNPLVKTIILSGPSLLEKPSWVTFGMEPDEKISQYYLLERLRLVKSEPVFYEKIAILNIRLPDFETLSFQNTSFYESIRERYGIRVTMSRQRFRAIKADKKTASLLKIKPGCPILHLERKFATNVRGLYIFSVLYAVTKNYILYSQS